MYKLPSGKETEIRKMRMSDEDTILDINLAMKGENIDKLMGDVTGLEADDLEEMLIGDRMYILIKIRSISRGKIFNPKVHCPHCRKKYEETINLDELEVTKLDREKFTLTAGRFLFPIELPSSNVKLIARLLTGKEEKELRKLREDHPDMIKSYLMMIRTHEIVGKKVKNVKFFRDLDIEDVEHFDSVYEEHEVGVETAVETTCPGCMREWEYNIVFDQNFFLQKRKAKKASKKK